MRVRAFITHKANECFADCQDRFSINSATGSVAVSDGMSQSLFPKFWAQLLAEKYTSESDWFPSLENVKALCPFWRSMVDKRLEDMRDSGISTWRTENMLTDGCSAGATLVGVRFNGNNWTCDVLGDSCLVEIEDNKVQAIYSSMTEFDNHPDYFDSDPGKNGKGEVKSYSGKLKECLLMVSDAMGEFLSRMRGAENEQFFIKGLLNVESADEFENLVEWWRKNGMHNDDTTLVIISNYDTNEPFMRHEEWVW